MSEYRSEGGDPACWAGLVCPECGAVRETEDPRTPCPRCGTAPEPAADAPRTPEAPRARRRRDRDPVTGRAQNARPRDGLGRPLPYGAEGVARAPEGVVRTPEETLTEAQRLITDGMPFHAHEVLEDAWKTGPGHERALWRALAQFAVGLTHAARGNTSGAASLLLRAADGLAACAADPPYGIDAAGLASWARTAAAAPGTELSPPPLRRGEAP
ncbi:DUF309 domain-containing protein [Streptomyces sp. HNM0574]|uniref:DUF309 domain-containing protein n=1 Tax=Streptomyces sp. HNM0574 TaxID=2714954 RepID=UPI00321655DD